MDTINSAAAIIGLVNGVTLLKEKNYWGFILFVTALASGLMFGFFNLFGLDPQTGFLIALASSGYYKGAQVISNKVPERTLP